MYDEEDENTSYGITWPAYSSQNSGSNGIIPVTGAPYITSSQLSYTGTVSSSAPPLLQFHNSAISLAPKTDIQYVIVTKNGDFMEFTETKTVTPREMIGICQFMVAITASTHGGLLVEWTELIKTLKIERHFTHVSAGSKQHNDSSVAYIFLYDPK